MKTTNTIARSAELDRDLLAAALRVMIQRVRRIGKEAGYTDGMLDVLTDSEMGLLNRITENMPEKEEVKS